MDVKKAIEDRYSCRKYQDKKVPQEVLDELLKAVELAPSAHNNQPTRVYVIDDEKSLQKLATTRGAYFGEPCVLLFTYDETVSWKRKGLDQLDSGHIDATICATQVALLAKEMGLETCFILALDPFATREMFDLPEQEQIVLELSLGYPREGSVPSKLHTMRNPVTCKRLEAK